MDEEQRRIILIRLETIIDRKQETRLKAREIMADIIIRLIDQERELMGLLAKAKAGESMS